MFAKVLVPSYIVNAAKVRHVTIPGGRTIIRDSHAVVSFVSSNAHSATQLSTPQHSTGATQHSTA